MKHKYSRLVLGQSELYIARITTQLLGIELLKAEKKLSHDLFSEWFPIKIGKKLNGAPDELDGYSLSNSHSHGWVAVARNNKVNMGMDLQVLSVKCERVRSKFLSDKDVAKPMNLSDLQYYTLLWSIKEAAYKWHEDFVELKNIVVKELHETTALISIHSSKGIFDCHAFFKLTPDWALCVVEK